MRTNSKNIPKRHIQQLGKNRMDNRRKRYQCSNSKRNAYRENNTNEYYRLPNGMELPLPEYYRKKIYSEEEREKLWIEKQERGYRYICGEKVSIDDEEEYDSILNYYRERAKELYNENYDNWEKERHKRQLEKLKEYQKEHKRGGKISVRHVKQNCGEWGHIPRLG